MTHSFPDEPPRHLPSAVPGRVRDTLEHWLWVRVTKSGRETWRVLGYRASDGVVYITSPVIAADPASHRVSTHSGSIYLLRWQSDSPDLRLSAHLAVALEAWGVSPRVAS